MAITDFKLDATFEYLKEFKQIFFNFYKSEIFIKYKYIQKLIESF